MIVILDYGMGNLGSILNMFKKVGAEAKLSSKIADIEKAKKLVLPGVGAFDHAMANLQKLKFVPVLNKKVMEEKTPVLGICLGMQLLSKSSEEGKMAGLGWLDANTVKFRFKNPDRKIPHMGWNTVEARKKSALLEAMDPEPRFYFVHSYHVKCKDEADVLCTTKYGFAFTSAVERENVFGVQFHPEKSHKFGMRLLKNFSEL